MFLLFRKISLLCLLLLWVATSNAADSLQLVRSIPIASNVFTTDKNENIYIATANGVYKYNNLGDSMALYSSVRRGVISQIDASNPMQILLYNANQNVITILDRLLVEKNKIELHKIAIYNCPTISNSADGDIWLYDAQNMLLQKVNEKLVIQNSSVNFSQQFASAINPVYITEQDRLLFIVDSTQGIIKMDAFGNYITTYHFNTKEVQYSNNQLVFLQNQQLVIYNTQNIAQREFNLPLAAAILQVRVERNLVYLRYANRIDIYSLQ